jgi:hypothetical protein
MRLDPSALRARADALPPPPLPPSRSLMIRQQPTHVSVCADVKFGLSCKFEATIRVSLQQPAASRTPVNCSCGCVHVCRRKLIVFQSDQRCVYVRVCV